MQTARKHLFVDAYFVEKSRTKAAIAAGYSPKTAHAIASKLMKDPWVAAEIAARQAKMSKKYEISAEKVLQELAMMAFAPLGHEHVSTGEKRAALVDLAKHLGLFRPVTPFDDADGVTAEENTPMREVARELVLAFQLAMRGQRANDAAPAAPPIKH